MARASAANPGRRSQKAAGAGARDPWEEAAAALRSRTPPDTWGTGTRQSTDARVTDAWGTWAPTSVAWGAMPSTEAPFPAPWGAMPSTKTQVTAAWGAMPSTEAPMTGSWGIESSEAAPVMSSLGPRASTEAPFSDTWGARTSRRAQFTDRWATTASTDRWPPRASEAARDAWGHGPSDAADNSDRSAPKKSRFTVPPPSGSEVLMNITVGNTKTFLHCGVCSFPLKRPIFQCDAGHVVCSPCRDDEPLGRGTRRTCNVCGGPGNRRCRLLEGLGESLRVACPNAANGCDATPAYYDLHAHRMACAHAPGTGCPVGCDFVAPVPQVVDHLTAVHWWPLTLEGGTGKSFDIVLCDGFNLVATAGRDDQQYLLLLNLVKHPFGRTVSATCIHPLPAAVESSVAAVPKTVQLELRHWAARHYQESEVSVPFVDLADGLPNDLAQFVVPKSAHPDYDGTLAMTAFVTIK